MFGFSVFLGSDMSQETKDYIEKLSKNGFVGMFTSMHIPEDDASQYVKRMTDLGALAKEYQLNLMVDISTKGLSTLGLDLEKDSLKVKELGITGLRMDYGISMKTIATASKEITIGLNASTLSEKDLIELKQCGANFGNMEFWHNYYPRVETGLDKQMFIQQNRWLKELGAKIIAFTPGDAVLRGPLFAGLPTLECHRFTHPLAASIELLTDCLVDSVYIGDEQISQETMKQFKAYQDEEIILLHTHFYTDLYAQLFSGTHINRMDVARDAIRSQEARFKDIPYIKQYNVIERSVGSVTLDNYLYGRYMGELQIAKQPLKGDPKVSVMGKVIDQDIPLLKWIRAGQKYQMI